MAVKEQADGKWREPFLGCKEKLGDLSSVGKDAFAIGKDF
jgi:hypothetical protein